jgi:hypothetical protein
MKVSERAAEGGRPVFAVASSGVTPRPAVVAPHEPAQFAGPLGGREAIGPIRQTEYGTDPRALVRVGGRSSRPFSGSAWPLIFTSCCRACTSGCMVSIRLTVPSGRMVLVTDAIAGVLRRRMPPRSGARGLCKQRGYWAPRGVYRSGSRSPPTPILRFMQLVAEIKHRRMSPDSFNLYGNGTAGTVCRPTSPVGFVRRRQLSHLRLQVSIRCVSR